MKKDFRFAATAISTFVALALGGAAVAQSNPSSAPSSAERNLMIKASQSNVAEIEEGRLAMTHSKNPQVQALGNRLVQDHSKAEDTLEALAATLSVKLPAKPSSTQEQDIARLRSLKGAAFDQVFEKDEVSSHQKTLAQLRQSAPNVHYAALKAWIAQNYPVLQEHLELAQNLPGSSRQAAQPNAAKTSADLSGTLAQSDRTDRNLLAKSMQGNLAEIALGRMAVTHSSNPVIQGLGTRIAQDGSKGVANLQAVAGMLHVMLPSKPSAAQEKQISALSKLHGNEFDARFQKIALTDERNFLGAFQSGVSEARNAAVKATVKNMIPVVEEHIQIAQAIPGQYPQRTAELSQHPLR